MNRHLQQFAQQLAAWTEAIIEHGRTPFRRVEMYPYIDTEQGVIQPPLVFWINRQSMMAGGVLFLPDNNLETELESGRNCATALGLRHFVTWEAQQARIWQIEPTGIKEQRSFPLSSPNHPETFRYLLADILEALKLLAILGAIPVTDLSPYYLNNLFQITLQQALPPLLEAYRSQRSENDEHATADPDTLAAEENRLRLLQVLSLLWFNEFPEVILPEKMDRAIELSLPALPNAIRQPLSCKATLHAPPLPLETAVCFYHLLLRLRQLSWNQPAERGKACIRRLIEYWYRDQTEEKQPATIQLYPKAPPPSATTAVLLSDSPSFLAATALLTEIETLPQCHLIFGNVFQLEQEDLSGQPVFGRLLNTRGIQGPERHEYTTRLRTAWPNRHLKIKKGQPFWCWELIHLLGLCHAGQNLTLELPINVVKDAENIFAWSLLCENYSFQQVRLLSNENIQLDILRDKKTAESFPLQLADEVREITPYSDPNSFRDQLMLALTLPTSIYNLLGNELIFPDLDNLPDDQRPGWKIYSQSKLYKLLQNILQREPGHSSSENKSSVTAIDTGIPYPESLLLNELASFEQGISATVQSMSIDQFLANLLTCPAIEAIEVPETTKVTKTSTAGISSEKKFKETIAQQLSAHGIPNFPEQYLYFLDQPEMHRYTMTPPLSIKSSLLGQFELEDAKGQIIAGYGEELIQILLFCAALGKTEVDLPDDRYQREQLLEHYRQDLDNLYKYLNNLCYSQVENSKSARKVIKTTWENLNLPDPSWFKN